MAFDFKKEYKEFYMPKNKPEIVNVPKANYIAVRGKGNPNEEGGAYQQAISVLYAVAYGNADIFLDSMLIISGGDYVYLRRKD